MMSVQFHIEEMPGYLAARFVGAVATEEDEQEFELIVEACERANIDRLLLDFTMVPEELSFANRYFVEEGAQIFAKYNFKVAAVCNPERHDSQCFGELMAQNRLVNLRAFTSVEDAERWLLE
jgi:hypothetical protein